MDDGPRASAWSARRSSASLPLAHALSLPGLIRLPRLSDTRSHCVDSVCLVVTSYLYELIPVRVCDHVRPSP